MKKTSTITSEAETSEADALPNDPDERREAIRVLIAQAFETGDQTLVVAALSATIDLEADTQRGQVVSTCRNWATQGEALNVIARLARDQRKGGEKVTASEAEKAARAAGVSEGRLARTVIGRSLRMHDVLFGREAESINLADAAFDTPDGPITWTATDLLTWWERRYNLNQGGSNRGKALATRAEADAAKAEKAEASEKAEAEAKAARKLQAEKASESPSVKVGNLVTLGKLTQASDENLSALVTACENILADRAEAKAEAEAKAKAEAKATQDEAKAEAEAIKAAAKAEAEAILAAAKAKASK